MKALRSPHVSRDWPASACRSSSCWSARPVRAPLSSQRILDDREEAVRPPNQEAPAAPCPILLGRVGLGAADRSLSTNSAGSTIHPCRQALGDPVMGIQYRPQDLQPARWIVCN